jgi:hypothetical protein
LIFESWLIKLLDFDLSSENWSVTLVNYRSFRWGSQFWFIILKHYLRTIRVKKRFELKFSNFLYHILQGNARRRSVSWINLALLIFINWFPLLDLFSACTCKITHLVVKILRYRIELWLFISDPKAFLLRFIPRRLRPSNTTTTIYIVKELTDVLIDLQCFLHIFLMLLCRCVQRSII